MMILSMQELNLAHFANTTVFYQLNPLTLNPDVESPNSGQL